MRSALKIQPPKRRRLIAAWFGIFALALPLLTSIAQGVPVSATPEAQQAPFYMVLCKAMQSGSNSAPEQKPDIMDCPVCLSFAFGKSVFFSALAESPALLTLPLAFNMSGTGNPLLGLPSSPTHARAPPVSV